MNVFGDITYLNIYIKYNPVVYHCSFNKMFHIQNEFVCLVGPKVVYVPPPPPEDEGSIFSQFATGINFDKYDDIAVEVSGSNPPKAIMVSYIDR